MPKSVITLGNPNGIGPEVTAKALQSFSDEELSDFILVGDQESINHYFDERTFHLCRFDFVGCNYLFKPGLQSPESGLASLKFLNRGIEILKNENLKSLITAPLSKELIVKTNLPEVADFTGHTGYLAKAFQTEKYSMMFYSNDLKVTLATIHVPLSEVSQKLTPEKLSDAIENADVFCRNFYGQGYKIAVCGLNPHAGENGLLGSEEKEFMADTVTSLHQSGIPVEGPFPSDSLFYEAYHGKYQMVIACYHDQGLAPFKMLHFFDGVNVTLGLPVVRTSPDHGTAFSVAGLGVADETSMKEAILLCKKLSEN